MHPALFSSCRRKCIFCIPPSVCRAIRKALPRRALAGRFRTRNPARAIDVDRLLASPYEPALRAAASARALLSGGFWRTSAALTAAVPAGRCQALYAAGYAGYVEPRGGLPYSV